MDFKEKLRESYNKEEESKKQWEVRELENQINQAAFSIKRIVEIMAKTGHFETLKTGKRRIHFYLGHSFPLTVTFIRNGAGFIRGNKESMYRFDIDLTTEKSKYFFGEVIKKIEADGITCTGPYIVGSYLYETLNQNDDYTKIIVMTKANINRTKKKSFTEWGIGFANIEPNPYSGHNPNGKPSYLPALEIEIEY